MASSTSATARARGWFELAAVTPDDAARLLRCSLGDARRRLTELATAHRDPAWIAARLGALSAPALVVLALLAERAYPLTIIELERAARVRFGVTLAQLRAALTELVADLLIVSLVDPTPHDSRSLIGPYRPPAFALVAPAAPHVAGAVRDLDAPVIPDAPLVPRPHHDGGRAVIAIGRALGQIELRLNRSGAPNRAGIKRLAKQLGLTETAVEVAIDAGKRAGLFSALGSDDVIRPIGVRLVTASVGRYPHDRRIDALVTRLRDAAAPIAAADADRWLLRATGAIAAPLRTAQLVHLPGFVGGRRGSVEVIEADPATAAPRAPAASVTPSFEVFLPPESSIADVEAVLEIAELTRVDRVIVARITRASVTRAVGDGASADGLIAALSRACRTPVPQNVEAAVRDWAGGVTVAITTRARVVLVPASETARVAEAIGAAARVLAPGVIALPHESSSRGVTEALRRAGLAERRVAVSPGDDDDTADPTADGGDVDPAALPVAAGTTAAALRTRIAAFRAGDPAELARIPAPDPAAAEPEPPIPADEAIAAWEHSRQVRLPPLARRAMLPMLARIAPAQRRFLFTAASVEELHARGLRLLPALSAGPGGDRDQVVLGFRAALIILADAEAFMDVDPRPDPDAPPDADADADADADLRSLPWQRDDLVTRLRAAAAADTAIALDLDTGIRCVWIDQLVRRGSQWALLCDDVDDPDVHLAIPVDAIRGIAALEAD
jgi:hypothetical protein